MILQIAQVQADFRRATVGGIGGRAAGEREAGEVVVANALPERLDGLVFLCEEPGHRDDQSAVERDPV